MHHCNHDFLVEFRPCLKMHPSNYDDKGLLTDRKKCMV